jgi:phosphopantetheine adenylyltransferase
VYESGLFDRNYVAIGNNAGKRYLFNLEERGRWRQMDLFRRFEKEKVVVEPFLGS